MNPLNSEKHNLIGKRFNFLTVTGYLGKSKWLCKCDCGNTCEVSTENLKTNWTKSCGHLVKERAGKPRLDNRKPDATVRLLFKGYADGAKSRNLDFQLTLEEAKLLFKSDCFYCKSPPSQIYKGRAVDSSTNYIYNGIDRFDNNLGYTTNNCVACCKTCNYAKRIMSFEMFKDWIERVYLNLFDKEK